MLESHSIPPEVFAEIARGDGGPEAITLLRTGQMSKHIAMILTVMAKAHELDPESCQSIDAAYTLLDAAQKAVPERVNALLAHPQVGLWGAHCLRQLDAGHNGFTVPLERDLGQLGAIAAVAGIAAGLRFQIEVPLWGGALMLPTLGLAYFDTDAPEGPAVVEQGTTEIRVCCGDQTVAVPADPIKDAPGWLGLRRLHSGHGDTAISVELIDPGLFDDTTEHIRERRIDDRRLAEWQKRFDGAWKILLHEHPDRARAMATGLTGVRVIPDDKDDFSSATTRDAFGYFEAKLPVDSLALAEMLVHEFQHSKMFALIDLVPLHGYHPEAIHFTPWRQDARPIHGVLQGTYAFLGVTSFWQVNRRRLTGTEYLLSCFEFARWRYQIEAAIETLLQSGQLTPAGIQVVQAMQVSVIAWRDEQIPPEPQRLSDQMALEHRVVWRIANIHPDAKAIKELADSWFAGNTCDAVRVPASIESDQTRRSVTRYLLTRIRFGDPSRFSILSKDRWAAIEAGFRDVTDADIAYLSDNFEEATRLFAAEIENRPHQLEHWAGLAVASQAHRSITGDVLTEAPEVLYALYHEILRRTATPPDLTALATWFAPAATPESR